MDRMWRRRLQMDKLFHIVKNHSNVLKRRKFYSVMKLIWPERTRAATHHYTKGNQGNAEGMTPSKIAARYGHLDVTKYLVRQGAEVSIGNIDSKTSLHSAANKGHIDVIKYLISQGALANKGDNDGWTALHVAAFSSHLDVIKYLISNGAEVNKGNNDGCTALHVATQKGHLDVTKYLISQGASVNEGDNDGWTAFHVAVFSSHLDVTKYLIIRGAEVNKGDNDGLTALHIAAQECHLDFIKYLISQGAELNRRKNDGMTALQVAAEEGHIDVTKYLISQGAEVNKGNNDGWTALHGAACSGHLDVTVYLTSQGAEVNEGDNDGRTALYIAAKEGHLDVIEYLISQGAEVNKGNNNGWTALQVAAQDGYLNVTEYLISQGAKVNEGDNDGRTALQVAAQDGYLNVTEYLISQGAEVNEGDNEGWTALQAAAQEGHPDVTKYLISQGAEVNEGDNEGWTALQAAAQEGHLDVTKYLISQGAEVNKANNYGMTALFSAAQEGHLDVTKYLISQGAEVNKGTNTGLTALYSAAYVGHLDVTKYLISQGAEVNKEGNDGRTALHRAAQNGHLNDAIKYLISQGAVVNKEGNDGRTALHLAASRSHLDVTEYLISHGAEVNKGDAEGSTALYIAAFNGHLDITKYLISHGAKVNKGHGDSWTALESAAREGHLDITEYLISQGAEVNERDLDGETALHSAAQNGHLDVTEYLISQGAEVNKGNNEGRIGLHLAALKGRLNVTKYLISQGAEVNNGDNDGNTALPSAAQNGHLDVTEYLISQGAEVDTGNNNERTALHLAAQNGHLDVSKYLISQGAEVNKGDNNGRTALHLAARNGHLDVTEYLISQGAEVNKGDNNGRTTLHVAAQKGHLDVTEYLISQGAKVNKGDNYGRTAFHIAAQEGHLDVTKYLISQGAEVNGKDNDGSTALHGAAEKGHLNVTKYLITQGAEVNKGHNEGSTVFHFAAQNGHLDVTEYLISQGAEVNKGDNDGSTPLHHAVQNGNIDVVKVLLAGGARSDTEDIIGQTPLQLALFLGYQGIAHLFIDRLNSKIENNDLTDIHLAITNCHTSIIEKLVSEGADLNVKSIDGQTCLHEAIKLCYKSETIMHDTDTLKEISDEYYKGELTPVKALVYYLLENGAKSDVKDKTGNLPIQYAKDEVVKQMILSRLPSSEEIQSYRDKPSSPSIISVEVEMDTSQAIELEDHGVSLYIPPDAVHQSDPCKITLTLLRDPLSVDIQDGESVVCYGIRCDPPNMIFHKPVKIRIPHYSLVMNPDQVKPDIVSCVCDSVKDLPRTSRKRSSSLAAEPPYCRMYERHLELYIGHCAEWWVLIPLEQQVIRHQLMCTPYIPDKIERGKEFEVHLQMHADLPGMETDIREEKKQQSYHKCHRSVPFSVESNSGDVTVTCHREGEQVESKVLSLKDVCGKMRHNMLLSVTPIDKGFTGITITITQDGRLGVSRSIAFIIRHTDGQENLSLSEPTSFLQAVDESLKGDLPDIDVLTIAQIMTVDQFYDFGVALGFTVQQLDVIEYRRFRDREQVIYDMLVTWRERQPPGQAATETLISLMESLESPAEEMAISGIGHTGVIPDKTLLAFARQIRPKKFYEIGEKLGFNKSELEHFEHRTLYNRKYANIQMLSRWISSQTSRPKAKQTLKLVWESVQDASKAEKTEAGTSEASADESESDQGTTEAEKDDYDDLQEKAQSDGIHRVEQGDHALDDSSATGNFGALGGKLSTKSHGFTLHIPPGALEEDEEISLKVLTDIPNDLTLKEDELLASHGFQCYPSGLRFKKPLKLIIPHCALVTAPNKVQTVLYSWNQSGAPKRLPHSSDIICSVQERWLEVSMSHFSGGYFALIWDWLFLKGILLSCMSFLPRVMPSPRKPILEVRFVKMPHDQKWQDVHALTKCGSQPVKDDDDSVVFCRSTLTVSCQLGENIPATDDIQHRILSLKPKETVYFTLDLTDESDETLVTLKLVQTDTQKIKFNTRFQEQEIPSPTHVEIDTVSERLLNTLAAHFPHGKYHELSDELGIEYNEASGILIQHGRDSKLAIRECLSIWKNRAGGSFTELKLIFHSVHLGGIWMQYME